MNLWLNRPDALDDANKVAECLCWVGHGGCGGCSDYPGIKHEPACGWDQNPDCPVHGFDRGVISDAW